MRVGFTWLEAGLTFAGAAGYFLGRLHEKLRAVLAAVREEAGRAD